MSDSSQTPIFDAREVAQALGLTPGQPARLTAREPGPKDDPILARVAAAMAELAASGGEETPSPRREGAPEAPAAAEPPAAAPTEAA